MISKMETASMEKVALVTISFCFSFSCSVSIFYRISDCSTCRLHVSVNFFVFSPHKIAIAWNDRKESNDIKFHTISIHIAFCFILIYSLLMFRLMIFFAQKCSLILRSLFTAVNSTYNWTFTCIFDIWVFQWLIDNTTKPDNSLGIILCQQ